MKTWLLLADHQNYQGAGFIAERIPSNPKSVCRLGKRGRTQSSSKGKKLQFLSSVKEWEPFPASQYTNQSVDEEAWGDTAHSSSSSLLCKGA